jgi:hypothetical protein
VDTPWPKCSVDCVPIHDGGDQKCTGISPCATVLCADGPCVVTKDCQPLCTGGDLSTRSP